jgi:ABC-type branched-subunit amino acid transport system ATPase component
MIVIETRALSKRFGMLQVTDDVSLSFDDGRRYAIVGPNGAGKTTFFNLLAGELQPSSGRILFEGRDVTALDVTSRARIGIARSFQRNNLFADLTVRDSLMLACTLRDGHGPVFWRPLSSYAPARARAASLLDQVGLAEHADTIVRELSYGSQRQLEVGMALACRPTVLLLDEPTSGMSPEETARMHRLIADLPRAVTLIVIEHDMDIVLDIADRIVVLDYGRVLAEGTPAEIRNSAVVRERYLAEAISTREESPE